VPTGTEFIRALEHHRAEVLARRLPEPEAVSARLLISWIHHDNMLEGTLYRPAEIAQALSGEDNSLDRYLHPLMRRIRAYRDTILFVHARAHEGVDAVSVENLRTIHRMLTPDPRDRGGMYRRNSPVHRDYYQQICAAEKVPYHLRKLFDQIQEECDEACDPASFAAVVHHRLMFVYPFRRNPGTTARLFTNLLLMSRGYPPAIIQAPDRAEYYEALDAPEPYPLARLFRRAIASFLDERGHNGMGLVH
jgi:Fic family protein